MSLPDLFSALADPTRLRVLELLHDRARPVHELAAAFAISRPAISRHLRVLKQAGLVREVKQGRENLYSLQRDRLRPGLDWLVRHRARPGAAKAPVTAGVKARAPAPKSVAVPKSPPKAAPQLSFFDL